MTASMAVSSKTTQNSLYDSKSYKPFPANNLNNNNNPSKKKPVGGSEREEREQEEDHNTNEEDEDDDDHVFHLDLSNNINLYNR